jgi:hypothetical protein
MRAIIAFSRLWTASAFGAKWREALVLRSILDLARSPPENRSRAPTLAGDRMMRISSGVVCTVAATMAYAAQQGDLSNTPVLWKGVEVVTNDFDSIERIRGATPLPANSVLVPSDAKLRIACDAVRNRVPSSKVECSHALEPSKSGRVEGWFVVEVDIPQRAVRCLQGARLDPRLVALSQQWLQAVERTTPTDASQRVNARNYLDYEDTELSVMAARLYAVTKDRTLEVEAGAVSCSPLERMHSLYLMNFTGDPQRFVTMASVHLNDDHGGAADAAAQFLATFPEFIEAQDVPHVANEACKGVLNGNFAARRRAIRLLTELQDAGAVPFPQLPAECQHQLRNIARTSLALPAKQLVGLTKKEPS